LIVEAAYATEGARLGIAGKSVWGNFGLALPIGFREEAEISHKPFFEQAQSLLLRVRIVAEFPLASDPRRIDKPCLSGMLMGKKTGGSSLVV
jgi:hypothetical protein